MAFVGGALCREGAGPCLAGAGLGGGGAGPRSGRGRVGRALGAYRALRSHSRRCAPPGRVHVKRRPSAPPSLPSLPPSPSPPPAALAPAPPGPLPGWALTAAAGVPAAAAVSRVGSGWARGSPRCGHEPTPDGVGGGGGGTGVASGESQEEGLGQVPQLLAGVGDGGSVHRGDDAGRGRGRRGGPPRREAASGRGARSVRRDVRAGRWHGRWDRTTPDLYTRA